MKRHRYAFGCGMLVLLMVAATGTALAAPLCIQTSNGVKFSLGIGTAGDAIIVNGFRADPGSAVPRTPLEGTGFVNPAGAVILGWTENYQWGTGAWVCPIGDTVIKAAGSSLTYDTTYLGATNCPNNSTGTFTVISCTGLAASGGEAAGAEANMR